ncbi:MAG: hypothetical protein U0176_17550 [Bacteroidia bacterium]
MVRLVTYFLLLILGLTFWGIELYFNYEDYVSHDPRLLGQDYQMALMVHKPHLIFAEMLFPLIMTVAFLLMLGFKFFAKSVRVVLGIMMLTSTEFWIWRLYSFKWRLSELFLQDEMKDPMLTLPNSYDLYLVIFALGFLVVLFLREHPRGTEQDERHAMLRRSLRRWD